MTEADRQAWLNSNHEYLMKGLGRMRHALEQHALRISHAPADGAADDDEMRDTLIADEKDAESKPALQTLCKVFDLLPIERAILLLCAGVELAADFPTLCTKAQGDSQRNYVTYSLALALWPASQWSALTPHSPLRRWRLIEMEPSRTLVHSPLRIDERILHYLAGHNHLDERLASLAQPLLPPAKMVDSHVELVNTIHAMWTPSAHLENLPVLHLCGPEVEDKRTIAAATCAHKGLGLFRMPYSVIPGNPAEAEDLRRLWQREVALSHSALLIDADASSGGEATVAEGLSHFLAQGFDYLIVTSRDRHTLEQHLALAFDVAKPTPDEQKSTWAAELMQVTAPPALDQDLQRIVDQFDLNTATIVAVATTANARLAAQGTPAAPPPDAQETPAEQDPRAIGNMLWDLCRLQARPRLDDLAQRIETRAKNDDLILPRQQRDILNEIKVQVRQRRHVYDTWQFESKGKRGLGISALFAGTSGTGKTMAAEVLAQELSLDLYRIDLSAVVSKYIGETEKNLRRIFDAADAGGVLLLFDEADALFGKRSQVKDSHDRYANIEVSYLLQRMEAYRGLAILTTNLKDALDNAFLRRLRFVVTFPFPDIAQRAEIWQHIFPEKMSTDALDFDKLARLTIAGGNIHNIALNAAFMAAHEGKDINMEHLKRATELEYAKLERTLTDSEIRGWLE